MENYIFFLFLKPSLSSNVLLKEMSPEQMLSSGLSFVSQTWLPNFRPVVNIFQLDFGQQFLLFRPFYRHFQSISSWHLHTLHYIFSLGSWRLCLPDEHKVHGPGVTANWEKTSAEQPPQLESVQFQLACDCNQVSPITMRVLMPV